MKLFYCLASGIDYDPQGHVVAATKTNAEEIFKKELDEEGVWYAGYVSAEEVEVEGYKIEVESK